MRVLRYEIAVLNSTLQVTNFGRCLIFGVIFICGFVTLFGLLIKSRNGTDKESGNESLAITEGLGENQNNSATREIIIGVEYVMPGMAKKLSDLGI